MALYHAVTELVGNTPLLQLERLQQKRELCANLFAKLEMANPAGSAKDRIGLEMILAAERDGVLRRGATLIEPTSGNTGIGLCAAAVALGYSVIITMPETMSVERQKLMRAYGAQLVLTPGDRGMAGAIEKAQQLHEQLPGSFIPGQFDNPNNAAAHYKTTGPEIFRDLSGQVDVFVAGIGTGGTITGVGRYLKEQRPSVQIVGVEPAGSPVLSAGRAGRHGIQGIGAGFVPRVLDTTVYDTIMTVEDRQALDTARELVRTEGVLCGISSGAALYAAIKLSEQEKNRGKNVVVLLPDTGERYLSTELFSE